MSTDKIIIWGVNSLGKYAAGTLLKEGYDVKAFTDNNKDLCNKKVQGIFVISPDELEQIAVGQSVLILVAVRSAKHVYSIMEQLKDYSVDNIGIIKPGIEIENGKILLGSENEAVIWCKKNGEWQKVIPRLQTNLVDGCNLNCKGCMHFSSLFPRDNIYPLQDFKNDLLQIRKLGKLVRFRLLGGEPLLIDNLDEYMKFTRQTFPETDIELVTNGLLFAKTDKKILTAINEYNIRVTISLYPPTFKMKEQIAEILNQNHIVWSFTDEVHEFARNLTLKRTHNPLKSEQSCIGAGCIFLHRGKLYKCPVIGLVHKVEEVYQISFDRKDRGIDIRKVEDVEKIYEQLVRVSKNPSDMCAYCAEEAEVIEWEALAKPELKDWLYRGEL